MILKSWMLKQYFLKTGYESNSKRGMEINQFALSASGI